MRKSLGFRPSQHPSLMSVPPVPLCCRQIAAGGRGRRCCWGCGVLPRPLSCRKAQHHQEPTPSSPVALLLRFRCLCRPAPAEVPLSRALAAAAVPAPRLPRCLPAGMRTMRSALCRAAVRRSDPDARESEPWLQRVTPCQQLLGGTGDLKSNSIIANKP